MKNEHGYEITAGTVAWLARALRIPTVYAAIVADEGMDFDWSSGDSPDKVAGTLKRARLVRRACTLAMVAMAAQAAIVVLSLAWWMTPGWSSIHSVNPAGVRNAIGAATADPDGRFPTIQNAYQDAERKRSDLWLNPRRES